MKRMKKLLAFLLAAMLLLSMIPISASAAEVSVQSKEGYFTLTYDDGGIDSTVTVILNSPQGDELDRIAVNDARSAQQEYKVTLTEMGSVTYDIESIKVTKGNPSQFSVKPDECTFNIGSLATGHEATIVITLAPQFVSPEVEEGVSGSVLYYTAYEPDLLELLHDNGVEGVDEKTKISGVSFHFVDDYYLWEDKGLTKVASAGNNLMYFHLAAGLSNVQNDNTPNNIRYVEIEYTLDGGGKQSVKIYSDRLYYAKDGDHTYRIESIDREDSIVVFYEQSGGATKVWKPWDVHFVTTGDNFTDHKVPEGPTYGGEITFVNWDHGKDGGDPFLPYEDINDNTILYGHVVSAGEHGVTVFHVMNTNGTLIGRFLELYNAEHPDNTATNVEISKIKVSGGGKSTNPDYDLNDWHEDDYYLVNNNLTGTGGVGDLENEHISIKEANTVTLYGTVGGQEYQVDIPISSDPGCFSLGNINTASGGGVGIAVELTVNPEPDEPDGDDWGDEENPTGDDLYGKTKVVVDCVNGTADHADGNYKLEDTDGTMKWSADKNAYVYEIAVAADDYVAEYNKTNPEHELTDDSPTSGTIVLVFEDDKWSAVNGKDTVTFEVTCKDEQGGEEPGEEPGVPEKPDNADIIDALDDIIKVECATTKNHPSGNPAYYNFESGYGEITALSKAVEGSESEGYKYRIKVSLTDDNAKHYIDKFDSQNEHELTGIDPTDGQEFTLVYLPAQENVNEAMWIFDTNESDKFLTINVTCKDGGEQPGGDDEDKTPDEPTQEELKDLLRGKVTVTCVNGKREHNTIEEVFGFLEKGIARNEIIDDGHGNFTTSVTVNGPVYVDAFEDRVKDAHKLTSDTVKYPTIQLKWAPNEDDPEDGSWTLDAPNAAVTFKVTCDVETVTTPGGTIVIEKDPEDPTDPDQTGVSDLLETDDHIQYLFGYPDDSFGPDRNMTRAEAAQMFYNLLKNQNVDAEPAFDDVPKGAWYATPVNVMAELGIVDGVGDDKFEPNREITRAEFTTMAMRFADVPSGGVNIFTDVAPSDWFYSYVVNSIQYGWIEGYGDGTFRPDRLITRAEVTTIVNRMLDRQADMAFVIQNRDKLTKFTDLTTEHWAYYTIVEATNEHNYKKPAIGEDWTSLK